MIGQLADAGNTPNMRFAYRHKKINCSLLDTTRAGVSPIWVTEILE